MEVRKYLEILDVHSGSCRYAALVIEGGNHHFDGREKLMVDKVCRWLKEDAY